MKSTKEKPRKAARRRRLSKRACETLSNLQTLKEAVRDVLWLLPHHRQEEFDAVLALVEDLQNAVLDRATLDDALAIQQLNVAARFRRHVVTMAFGPDDD